jgi:DNA-binding LytR/AlgR family response regulator
MGNYSTIYFIENGLPKKEVIRATMKNIESELSKDKNIVRCHKSFFVNIDKITTTSGNARALYLHLNELDFPIPVSRGFSNNMLLLLN